MYLTLFKQSLISFEQEKKICKHFHSAWGNFTDNNDNDLIINAFVKAYM